MKVKQKVLIVEDEEVNRKILCRILMGSYEVLEAENGQQALDIIAKKGHDISAVLLDIVMPVMNGYQVLETLKDNDVEDFPIIVMTGESDSEAELLALDAGAWDFVTKPYNPRVLLIRLGNAIARSQLAVYEKLQKLSQHDTLTGLYNRGEVYTKTKQLLEENQNQQFAFVRLDIDHFSLFNTSFGEKEGDKLLCFLANMLEQEAMSFPKLCVYGRITADVFCICFPCTDEETIRKSVGAGQRLMSKYPKDYLLEISVGVYIIDEPNISVEECFIRATRAAKLCKNQYNTHVEFYDKEMDRNFADEMQIVSEMETALKEEQFLVYFQPKFKLSTESVCGAEALVRWNHPVRGLISPGLFVPVFEKNGFIANVDYYVWEKTCVCLREWMDAGYTPFPVSVNISRISLYNPQLVNQLVGLVEKYGIRPYYLQLEITESAVMTNPDLMQKAIHALREKGFTILMDDFGSGYSSLNTLKTLEFDVLKVDMKFLPVGNEMEKGEIILASVIKMANWLGMDVVVEGVETRIQRDFLEGAGCDCIQGYFYSRPVPRQEYEDKYVFQDMINMNEKIKRRRLQNTRMSSPVL